LSTREKEFEHLCFPCEKLFDTFEWQNGYLRYWKFDPAKTELFMRFQAEVLQRFQSYQIPVIKLKKTVQKEAVCHVFEKVNTGGVVLNAFELLTATYAAENFRLRDDWYGSTERKVDVDNQYPFPQILTRGAQASRPYYNFCPYFASDANPSPAAARLASSGAGRWRSSPVFSAKPASRSRT
jgi:hypothetical protein